MSHLSRGPARRVGIDSKASGASGRRGVAPEPNSLEEAVA
jgi:hypothetical protein